jgi:nuclear pore complex protein Nup88
VYRLVPNEAGSHIALVGEQALAVMTLPRSRGEHGEFGGGKKTVTCRVTPIATDLFTIHHHTIRLLQSAWHPSLPLTLLLLTNDSTLRIFSLADPNYPRYSVPLSTSAANQVHSCSLEDMVVSFACTHTNRLFALRDTGDVIATSLATPTSSASSPSSSEPLPMHPMSEDNYGTDDAAGLILLETTPLVLIIAHSGGTLYHCVYMESDEEREEEEEEDRSRLRVSATSGILYVVECVRLTLEMEDDPISLFKDPVLPYRYFITHGEGVHMVTLPWAGRMDQFATTSVDELVMQVDSDIQLVTTFDPSLISLLGLAVVSEPLLGAILVCLDSDLQCHALSLQPPPPAQYMDDIEATPTRPHPQVKPEAGGFEGVIRDLLNSDHTDPLSYLGPKSATPTQQECFKYLQRCMHATREKYLLPQQKVKAAIQHRLEILQSQKEQQLRDLMILRDDCTEVVETCESTREKLYVVQKRGAQLLNRMERLLCQLESQSPILSDAEVGMEQELSQLLPRLEAINSRIHEAKGKLKLGYGEADGTETVKLSNTQGQTISIVLEES